MDSRCPTSTLAPVMIIMDVFTLSAWGTLVLRMLINPAFLLKVLRLRWVDLVRGRGVWHGGGNGAGMNGNGNGVAAGILESGAWLAGIGMDWIRARATQENPLVLVVVVVVVVVVVI